jgi:hypothetical protein
MWKNKEKIMGSLILFLLVAVVFYVCSRNAQETGHITNDGNTEKKATEGIPK